MFISRVLSISTLRGSEDTDEPVQQKISGVHKPELFHPSAPQPLRGPARIPIPDVPCTKFRIRGKQGHHRYRLPFIFLNCSVSSPALDFDPSWPQSAPSMTVPEKLLPEAVEGSDPLQSLPSDKLFLLNIMVTTRYKRPCVKSWCHKLRRVS